MWIADLAAAAVARFLLADDRGDLVDLRLHCTG